MALRWRMVLAFVLLLSPLWARAQDFSQRGFGEATVRLYPQTAPNDATRAVAEALFRYEPSWKARPWLRLSGSFDARADTHDRVASTVDWWDRGTKRPALSVRRLSATFSRSRLTVEVGKQFVRWGKADVLNPTDRFAPRDYLDVVDNDWLGVTAARLTYGGETDTIDLVWAPRVTPSRMPLFTERWTVAPAAVATLPVADLGSVVPRGSQAGARWNHLASGYEYSLSFYQGFNHLPLLDGRVTLVPPRLQVVCVFPQMRMYGGDAAVPLKWLTVKGEAAYFTTTTPGADQYALYVVQLERQSGEWFFVGGYAGEWVTRRRGAVQFSPERGLAHAFLGRAGYTIDTNRSLAFEGAVRRNGDGLWTKAEYSQASGQHWRTTVAFHLIRGGPDDFLGHYRRNSHLTATIRYSF